MRRGTVTTNVVDVQMATPEPARCWICRAVVTPDEATIAPTVCARCFDELVRWWR